MPTVELNYVPFPSFVGMHLTRYREACIMGSVGSGKTIGLCADGIRHCLEQAGSRAMICRRTGPALGDTTEAEFLALLGTPAEDWDIDTADDAGLTLLDLCTVKKGQGGRVDHIWFPNGSLMLFRPLDNWTKIMSLNLSWIGVDEANEIDATTYVNLVSRLRQNRPLPKARRMGVKWDRDHVKQKIVLATNSHGHNWVWDFFINNPTKYRRIWYSTSFDNPTLYNSDGTPGDYLMSLLSMPEVWVRRFVLCDTDAFEGQILEFNPEFHTHTHFEPPASWDRAMGMDWGLRSAVALVWWARDPDTGKWYQYREWSTYNYFNESEAQSRVTPTVTQIAQVIKGLEQGETIKWRAADPEIWRRRTGDRENQTVDYYFQTHGIYFQAGAGDYSHRINAFNQLLHNNLWSCSDKCPITQVAVQQYRWEDVAVTSTKDGPERPHKKNDHHVDANEYLATLFMQQLPVAVQHRPATHDEVVWKRIKNKIKQQARGRWSPS